MFIKVKAMDAAKWRGRLSRHQDVNDMTDLYINVDQITAFGHWQHSYKDMPDIWMVQMSGGEIYAMHKTDFLNIIGV